MKKCIRCNVEKSDSDYYANNKNGYGECKICMNTRNIVRLAKIKQQAVTYKGGACEECGYNKNLKALDFHHKDPTKKDFGFAAIKNCSWEKVKPEVDKCTLLCSNCHRETHDKEWRAGDTVNWELYNQLLIEYNLPYFGNIFPREPTYCKCGIQMCFGANQCRKCAALSLERTIWPTDAELQKILWEVPTSILAEQLGVSDVAIAHRAKRRGLTKPSRGYWTK